MAPQYRIVNADKLIEKLRAEGVVPQNCRRVVLDLEAGEAPKLYFEIFGDERLLKVFAGVNFEIGEEKS